MSAGKIIGVIALAAALVGAVVFAFRHGKPSGPPESVLAKETELVGVKEPFEIRKVTVGEKQKLSVDAETGYYKMDGSLWASPVTCVSCGTKVPECIIKPGTERPGQVLAKYICPKCGQKAYRFPGGRRRGMQP